MSAIGSAHTPDDITHAENGCVCHAMPCDMTLFYIYCTYVQNPIKGS
jgi:hypothetical protein